MPGTSSFFYHRRFKAFSVIADEQDKCVIIVANLCLDVLRVCMLECISQQLTANAVNLLSNARKQILPLAPDDHLKGWTIRVVVTGLLQLLTRCVQQFSKICRSSSFDPQVLDRVSAFGDCLLGSLDRAVQRLKRVFRATRKEISGSLEPKHETMQGLEQCIVQIASDACALVQARLQSNRELLPQLSNTQLIGGHQQKQKERYTTRSEPCGLVVGRKDSEVQRGPGFVPNAIVIACNNVETIGARTQIVIKRLTPCPWLLPSHIMTVQPVPKENFLWRQVAESRVIDLEVTSAGWQP